MEYSLKETLDRLTGLLDNWLLYSNKRDRSNTENTVIQIINNRQYIPDDIYIEACGGSASGLCQHGFFENDLRRLIFIIKSKLGTPAN